MNLLKTCIKKFFFVCPIKALTGLIIVPTIIILFLLLISYIAQFWLLIGKFLVGLYFIQLIISIYFSWKRINYENHD